MHLSDEPESRAPSRHVVQVIRFHTKTDRNEVLAELAVVRERGYATCLGEIDEGLAAVGVPLVLGHGEVIFSLGITGPYSRVLQQGIEPIVDIMTRYSKKMSASIAIGFEKQRAG